MRGITYFAFDSKTTLTNFYPCKIVYEGITYHSSEAIYQSRKTLDSSRWGAYANVTPVVSKRMGRAETLRPDWDKVKFQIMYSVLEAKFNQVPEFRKELMSTGSAILIEDTTGWHDNVWGICSCEKCKDKPYSNLLGLALTVLRETKKGEGTDYRMRAAVEISKIVSTPRDASTNTTENPTIRTQTLADMFK